jgi:predicted nucleic acid-binding protein
VIVDASVVLDLITDSGVRAEAADQALSRIAQSEPLVAPGHFAVELMSGLKAIGGRPRHRFTVEQVQDAISHAGSLGIHVEAIPWVDISRAWELAGSLRFADALYVAAAERHETTLLTCDARIARSGAPFTCQVLTVQTG